MPTETEHLEATFGIEIECYLPEGASQQAAAAAVAHRLGAPCIAETYNHFTRNHWKVVTDGSLGDISRGIEFVSPILKGEAGLQQVEKVCAALTDFGCTVSKRCGLHVHVGVGNAAPLGFFKNLVRLYSVFEPVIDSIMPTSRRASNNMYCRSMTSAQPSVISSAQSLDALIMTAGGATTTNERRHFKLNLAAYSRHKTVEFRHHSGTLDGHKARRWAVLCLRMVAASKQDALALGTTETSLLNRARPNSKAYQVGQMMLRPEGATGREVCAALNWPTVSMPQQAAICGLAYTTQRTGREVRYFASAAAEIQPTAPITVAGFAETIGATDDERMYMEQRAANLAGPIQWAA